MLSCFVNLMFVTQLRLKMSNSDSQKTTVNQLKVEITVSRHFTVCIQTTAKVYQSQGVFSEGIVRVGSEWNEISLKNFEFPKAG